MLWHEEVHSQSMAPASMNFYFWCLLSLGDPQASLTVVQKAVNKRGKPRQAGVLLLSDDLK